MTTTINDAPLRFEARFHQRGQVFLRGEEDLEDRVFGSTEEALQFCGAYAGEKGRNVLIESAWDPVIVSSTAWWHPEYPAEAAPIPGFATQPRPAGLGGGRALVVGGLAGALLLGGLGYGVANHHGQDLATHVGSNTAQGTGEGHDVAQAESGGYGVYGPQAPATRSTGQSDRRRFNVGVMARIKAIVIRPGPKAPARATLRLQSGGRDPRVIRIRLNRERTIHVAAGRMRWRIKAPGYRVVTGILNVPAPQPVTVPVAAPPTTYQQAPVASPSPSPAPAPQSPPKSGGSDAPKEPAKENPGAPVKPGSGGPVKPWK